MKECIGKTEEGRTSAPGCMNAAFVLSSEACNGKAEEGRASVPDCMDAIFVVSSEAYKGEGEDSFCCSCSDDSAMIAVFDGCGGLGSRKYDNYGGHTGAYIASRLASGAVYDWFQNRSRTAFTPGVQNTEDRWKENYSVLKARIAEALSMGEMHAGSTLKLRGSMVRDFPTTAAIALAEDDRDKVRLRIMWAGDSRIYFLGSGGLMPLSRDDTDSVDAFEDLRNDPVQTNVLSSDGRFTLHTRTFALTEPVLIIAVTDGYFGYWNTPMDFEYFLLNTLEKSGSLEEWKMRLREEIQDVTGDDAALAAMAFCFGTFERMKACFTDRHQTIEKNYIRPLTDSVPCSEEKARALWKEYSIGYEKYL